MVKAIGGVKLLMTESDDQLLLHFLFHFPHLQLLFFRISTKPEKQEIEIK